MNFLISRELSQFIFILRKTTNDLNTFLNFFVFIRVVSNHLPALVTWLNSTFLFSCLLSLFGLSLFLIDPEGLEFNEANFLMANQSKLARHIPNILKHIYLRPA